MSKLGVPALMQSARLREQTWKGLRRLSNLAATSISAIVVGGRHLCTLAASSNSEPAHLLLAAGTYTKSQISFGRHPVNRTLNFAVRLTVKCFELAQTSTRKTLVV